MNNQSITSQEIPIEIVNSLKLLSPEQREQVFSFVFFLANQQKKSPIHSWRVFGQYQGRIAVSEDFDEPLSDSFWLGES